jgi:glycosyltransferase involved in cell wall biosynthesis
MISFIVPAHDEARLLGATLVALRDAATGAGQAWETVVVDDASTDATAQIAERHGARVVRVEHRQIAATRNAGARAAKGDVLVFVDADTLVDATLLSAALAAIEGGAVGGGATIRLQGTPAWHERWAVALLARAFRATGIAPGCFVFCTPAAFAAAGGFDERYFAAEDIALSRALARIGRFVVLRQPVWTSDRKLRTHSVAEHLRLVLRFGWHGTGLLKSRRDLALWYGERRDTRQ